MRIPCWPPLARLFTVVSFAGISACPMAAAAGGLPGATPDQMREFLSLKASLGMEELEDGEVLFRTPYDLALFKRVLSHASCGSGPAQGRRLFFVMMTKAIQFWEVPESDLKTVRPALRSQVQHPAEDVPGDADSKSVLDQAIRCLWNLDYALAAAEAARFRAEGKLVSDAPPALRLKELESEAISRKGRIRHDYIADLVTWFLRLPDDLAKEGIGRLAQLERNHWRVMVAQDKMSVRDALRTCQTDDERAAVLMAAATDSAAIPVQGWAVRSLSRCPTDKAVAFLFKLYNAPLENNRRVDLVLEAQEVLRRLQKIPRSERRVNFME